MYQPQITQTADKSGVLSFTLSGVTTPFANALRRTILQDTPVIAFVTEPYSENKATINSTIADMNNEIIKQRLSSIPIHISDPEFPYQNYIVECEIHNTSDTVRYVTTADFKIRNTMTGKYLSDVETRNIFPPQAIPFASLNGNSGFHIFVRLKPQLAESNIPGEYIKMSCELSKCKSGDNGMFAQCICGYGFTPESDPRLDAALKIAVEKWRTEQPDITAAQIDLLVANWRILDSKRLFVQNSFDFRVESFGVYTNRELVTLGCISIKKQLASISDANLEVKKSATTVKNGFDVFIKTTAETPLDLYSAGYIIADLMNSQFFGKSVNFVGCHKFHPEDKHIVVRVGYIEPVEPTTVIQHIIECAKLGDDIYARIMQALK